MDIDNISDLIDQYAANRDNMPLEAVQEMRDDLAVALYKMHDFYSNAKTSYEAAEYEKKKCLSKATISMSNAKDESGRKMNREMISAHITLSCEEAYRAELAALKTYEQARHIVITCGQILNTLSSRISMMARI